ncbi:YceI family protein [Pseudobacteriovorax antillogorgiicola]|uniref:YceI-like domain-containing protein n=1 Tax=Pseudobacteriovorax antillogorgiicola TaxID=1513793 RepID=A0A1Y6BP24_9BACT|nr:YceI family protein [Pseudobacteriovorax antillogorgiicola]TCS55408.1 YceI-like domain-containing protein [Pseudobacteriovorax antillogorgiicola]SMF12795.1 YceI-like domain-containing protein [Pseudobacteriovorax antillogorgiicola]
MKAVKLGFLFATIALFLAPVSYGKTCYYQAPQKDFKVTWTGFKFTSKAPVSGSFDEVYLEQGKKAKSVKSLMNSLKVKIASASINSNLPARDKKLAMFIFGPIKNSGWVHGRVKKFDGKMATIELDLNGKKVALPFTVKQSSPSKYELKGQMTFAQFGMMSSFKAIADACKDLHTGPDKVAKTWEIVDLKVDVAVNESCS